MQSTSNTTIEIEKSISPSEDLRYSNKKILIAEEKGGKLLELESPISANSWNTEHVILPSLSE